MNRDTLYSFLYSFFVHIGIFIFILTVFPKYYSSKSKGLRIINITYSPEVKEKIIPKPVTEKKTEKEAIEEIIKSDKIFSSLNFEVNKELFSKKITSIPKEIKNTNENNKIKKGGFLTQEKQGFFYQQGFETDYFASAKSELFLLPKGTKGTIDEEKSTKYPQYDKLNVELVMEFVPIVVSEEKRDYSIGNISYRKLVSNVKGAIKQRKLIYAPYPKYPQWAKQQGIEGSVSVRFAVLPSGKIKKPLIVTKTSGYPDLDKEVVKILEKWVFEPLSARHKWKEEIGEITFVFSLTSKKAE